MSIFNHEFDAETTPLYFSLALTRSYNIYIVYFLLFIVCITCFGYPVNVLPVAGWLAACLLARHYMNRIFIRWNFLFYVIISTGWISYFIYYYGWNVGGTSFILPLMLISMFSLYDTTFNKIAFAVFLFILRMALFFHCQNYPPIYVLTEAHMLIVQVLNTILSFVITGVICLTFSDNLQKAEKHLMLYNIELRQQAGTDPLTTLYNRRRMEEVLENHIKANPYENFSIAIGDIDFFKKINDTYGHNCGDQVLKSLAELFKEKTLGSGPVCRWGGEEFLFFFPGMNLDNASTIMNEINIAVSKCIITYKDITVHVTMTFGVEENDYQSNISELIKHADDKLYYGKTHGRDTVIS